MFVNVTNCDLLPGKEFCGKAGHVVLHVIYVNFACVRPNKVNTEVLENALRHADCAINVLESCSSLPDQDKILLKKLVAQRAVIGSAVEASTGVVPLSNLLGI